MNTIILLLMVTAIFVAFMTPKPPLEEEWEYQMMHRKPVKDDDKNVFVRVAGLGEKIVPQSYELDEWTPIHLCADEKKIFPEHTCCGANHFVRLRNSNLDKIMAFECEKCGKKYVVVFDETS